jgi:hypothetical protein
LDSIAKEPPRDRPATLSDKIKALEKAQARNADLVKRIQNHTNR